VIGHDQAVEHINVTRQEEMPPHARNLPVIDVPYIVRHQDTFYKNFHKKLLKPV
jgi:hypothetical protein